MAGWRDGRGNIWALKPSTLPSFHPSILLLTNLPESGWPLIFFTFLGEELPQVATAEGEAGQARHAAVFVFYAEHIIVPGLK